jgi:prepilin-type N-terminal cleavage/methylation domain-containing protein
VARSCFILQKEVCNEQSNEWTKGFTLIEMVIVIVVMGILAAVAVPKFVSFSTDARVATMETLEGSRLGTEYPVKPDHRTSDA